MLTGKQESTTITIVQFEASRIAVFTKRGEQPCPGAGAMSLCQ
jgi:hypothetical protein